MEDVDTHYINAKMWNVGQFPCIKADDCEVVTGQLLDVTAVDLDRLDAYEGVPILYVRKQIRVKELGTDVEQDAYVYEWAGSTENLKRIATWDN